MPTDVIMPQMGESIAEGTILRWMKSVGDKVERDEPLFEISTDKVDAEIPSPVSGVLAEIRVQPNTTVPINTVVGLIAGEGEGVASSPGVGEETRPVGHLEPSGTPMIHTPGSKQETPRPSPAAATAETNPGTGEESSAMRIRTKSSPLVRSIAAKEGVDISQVPGSGIHGRVTKDDILNHLEQKKTAPASAKTGSEGERPAGRSASSSPSLSSGLFLLNANSLRPTEVPPLPAPFGPNDRVKIEPLSAIRKRIAENMVLSRRLNAHVTTFFEFDWGTVDALRSKHRARFEEQHGVKLTYLPFLLKAAAAALRAYPIVNAIIDGDTLVYKNDVNIGIAVALDWGLVVPVIRGADQLSIAGLARAASDLANRARARQLKVDEMTSGTFTITNPGVSGPLVGAPIIPLGQSAIMGFGGIEKRPVVVEGPDGQDCIGIRLRSYMSISFDHRLIDGAMADLFMSHIKKTIQTSDWPELG